MTASIPTDSISSPVVPRCSNSASVPQTPVWSFTPSTNRRHNFPDTRYRRVTYSLAAASALQQVLPVHRSRHRFGQDADHSQ